MVEVLFFLYIFRYLHDQIVTTWCNNRGKLLWWLRRWLHALFYASSNRSTLPPAVQQTQFCFFEMLIGVFLAHDIGNCYKSNHKSSLCVFFFFFFSLPCDVVQQGTSIILWVILQVHYVLSRMSNVKCHLMYIVIYPEYVTRTMAIVNCCILLS